MRDVRVLHCVQMITDSAYESRRTSESSRFSRNRLPRFPWLMMRLGRSSSRSSASILAHHMRLEARGAAMAREAGGAERTDSDSAREQRTLRHTATPTSRVNLTTQDNDGRQVSRLRSTSEQWPRTLGLVEESDTLIRTVRSTNAGSISNSQEHKVEQEVERVEHTANKKSILDCNVDCFPVE
jgi:hypothetical protein